MAEPQLNIGVRITPLGRTLMATDFIKAAENFTRIIGEVDIVISGQFARTVELRLRRLSYDSPAELVVEPIEKEKQPDNRLAIIEAVRDGISSLRQKDIRPRYFSDQALESARKLVSLLGDGIDKIEIFTERETIDCTESIATNVRQILRPGREMIGSIIGRLLRMDSHEGFEFALWEPVLGSRIQCEIAGDAPKGLKERIIGFYEQDVLAIGIVQMNRKGEVHSAKIREVIKRSTESVFHSPSEIAGLYDISGGVDAEEYVQRMRDAN